MRLAGKTTKAAHVNTIWSCGRNAFKYTFVLVRSGCTWLVDDEYCAGHSQTTTYKVPLQLCPSK